MNLNSNIVQKTIQSLLTDVNVVTQKILTPPDISEIASLNADVTEMMINKEDAKDVKNANKDVKNANKDVDKNSNTDTDTKNPKIKHNKSKTQRHNAVSLLYEKMNDANLEMNTQKNSGCFKYQETVVDIQSQVPRPESFSETYLTKQMMEYIKNEPKKILSFECKINNRTVRLFFIVFKNNNFEMISYYKTYAHRVYMWLLMVSKKSTCVETLNIYVYLTPFKKQIPENKSESIGPINANTGYTFRCEKKNEIIIYREEEWFKVLLHETMHAFGNDFHNENETGGLNIKRMFSLPDEIIVRMSETYSEIWARIMNVMFQTYFKNPPSLESRNLQQFKKNVDFYLHLESIFSLYQCIKILDFMGINYETLVSDSDHSNKMIKSFYRENTNVFAYYVLTSILLNSHDDFLSWCIKNNGSGLNMFKIKTTQGEFIELIKSCYKKNELLQQIVETEQKLARDYKKSITNRELITTLRMTIVGFD